MQDASPTKLLIVDDLPENLQALNALIRGDGREVFQAGSGEEALALLLQHDFAMAFLDVQMPGMDGFELAELMRGTEKTRQIPIVFVTAAGKELNYSFKGYEAGAVDVLYKPLDPRAVKGKVQVFVALYEAREAMRRQVEALELARQQQAEMQAQLERALLMRDEFMSMVSHEMRTPLNTLYLETQLRKMQLERGNMAAFGAEQLQRMVARDDRQIQSIIRLIDDMLDVSRIRSGKLSLRPGWVELSGLLRRVVHDLTPQATTAGTSITLEASTPVSGWWDEFRIEQIVVNLLTNAMRYGCQQPVSVSLTVEQDWARVDVRDCGPGVAPENQAKIFEPYERGVGSDAPAGLGLGLYISRQLAEVHEGSLTLHSTPGEGAVFSLTLPRRDAPPA
ncbi:MULTISPECIES: hybrid sensor histidine kinase/response regulator [unclassified Duganella]|uniref:hybrid sensor histidine kinase/response regulator n=1 Tax=unclassified Duganella TaxID=2636909 RepID=UPI00088D08C3|nr:MULTISPECIES: hybrid sensor histidine kinase/response regulator [unclassified Duganella]SDG93955.1 His Kinase A (phospho-acceptor) domain-containing protein [Duganella sp. OV458]SDJ48428.1 Signal transduction histidine kinase [Duganella sp. OV510]